MNSAGVLILIPFIFSLLSFVSGKKWSSIIALISSVGSLFYFLLLLSAYNVKTNYVAFGFYYDWIPSIRASLSFGMDAANLLVLMLTQIVVCLAVLATMVKGNDRTASYYGLIGLTHTFLNAFFSAQNPMTFLIFFEATLIPVYFLILNFGGPKRKQAVFKFFIYTVFGGLLMLLAILFYQSNMFPQLRLDSWADFYQYKLSLKYQYWLFAAFFIAFAIKAPLFPFHTWQADLYSQADRPTLMILAALLSKMGIYGFVRFNFFFIQVVYDWFNFITLLCVIGVVYGALVAWRQKDIIRLIAYSSLSHIGLMAAGTMTLTNIGMQGAMFAMLAHGLAVAGLIFVADVMIRRTNEHSVDSFSGIARNNPRFAVYFFIILLSAVGLPLTCGFIGEFYLIWALVEFKFYIGLVAALTLIFGAAYMLRWYQKTMFGIPSSNIIGFQKLSLSEDYIFLILVMLILILGLFPADWIGFGQFAYKYMNFIPDN
ncbi:MAG: NADH-quinone oxidoreductase subunit M [Saprospiraceae bacterium]